MKNIVYIFLISMLPFIELRGAVPVGAALGVPYVVNFLVAVVGNILPVPFILLLLPRMLEILNKFKIFQPMVSWLRKKTEKNSEKINGGAFFGLCLFVAIPFPGTGAWAGSFVAALFNMPRLRSFFMILLGVIICGVIMTLASYGILGFLSFLAS